MAEDLKPVQGSQNGVVGNELGAQAHENKITWLPAIMENETDLTKNPLTGLPQVNLTVYMPDSTKTQVRNIIVDGYTTGPNLPHAGSVFKVKWDNAHDTYSDLRTLMQNGSMLTATYVGSRDAMNTSLECKKWTSDANGFSDSPGSAKSWLDKGNTSNTPLQNLGTVMASFQACTVAGPQDLTEALQLKSKLDSTSGILTQKVLGDLNVGSAIMVVQDGIVFFSANNKATPLLVGNDGKVSADKMNINDTRVDTRQEMSGLKARAMVGDDLLPTGTIFTPRLTKLPSLDALEWVLKLVDTGKLIYDFFNAFSKVKR
jgi:hypothetical protein